MPGMPETNYQVIARKYRPQLFCDVVGQDAIVTLLKNSIKNRRLAHAYLFSGSRGTGKTTLARLLAKTLNCTDVTAEFEPCNKCSSCREIIQGQSLDVIEIDGASHRGIEEIRHINETVGYATATGHYRIYIIDEVHMLTKEAFNALLKTLEEPPPSVKFFFATTEPHKVLPTIISRCQRLHLRRLSIDIIVRKLHLITQELGRQVEDAALHMVAARAQGGLRDAESLLDQLLSFYEGPITLQNAAHVFGLLPQDTFFQLDQAGKEGHLGIAFDIAADIFQEGKDLAYFVQMLTEHYRHLLVCKLGGATIEIPAEMRARFQAASELYLKEQLLSILELCLESEQEIRLASSPRIALEGLLLKILRSHTKIPLDHLIKRLIDLEKRISEHPAPSPTTAIPAPTASLKPPSPPPIAQAKEISLPLPPALPTHVKETSLPLPVALSTHAKEPSLPPPAVSSPPGKENHSNKKETLPPLPTSSPRYDTIMQFAAVELEGKIIKK